jgi:hypothetical protein
VACNFNGCSCFVAHVRSKHFETVLHLLSSVLFRPSDLVHDTLGRALCWIPTRGKKTLVSVQGLEWKRKSGDG